ncbi:TPA: DUF2778 domain-containing protein [Klebsiella aerogenes]|nr:DUF2778 domain-containing protein [Klebsiella aerogenes]HBU6643104.1 DUF2778 domain-containing protein [Klebsiella aerogenes]HBW0089881.1 DUF2778 domain-containing protein [Klebsiella aerogenes]HBY9711151.1 DUF2778 domain-containing protein [Klebsiella aerogenes]HDU4419100.1 DUF2778 domain-containing protein [Klebsiella aerogenes]
MIQCEMDYSQVSADGKTVKLTCYGVGTFDVFSGVNPTTNIAECAFKDKAALPPGTYWIVPRPVGSFANRVLSSIKDWRNGTDHSEWFGLYNNSTMSDHLFVNGVNRGGFRLHPLRPDGSGESWGCITFHQINQFQVLRRALLSTKMVTVKTGVSAYGRVLVRGSTDYANCKIK